jgi:isocitrate dehydrogenase (NAD+)
MKVTLVPGDGIGPEITEAAQQVLEATGVPIEWERRLLGLEAEKQLGQLIPPATLNSFRETGLMLKGPLTTPVGEGFKSMNVMLRQEFKLFANIRPARTFYGVKSPYQDVNIVLFRENIEGEYAGKEHGDENTAYMEYHVTKEECLRIVRAAFDYAKKHRRYSVTLVHKANILKLTSGMLLNAGFEIAALYPNIQFRHMIVDNCCQQLVLKPQQFDVMVTSNLFGDILGDLNAALVGGVGLTGSANIGERHAMFEAVHGSAPDIVGKGIANPTSLMLAGALMLAHAGHTEPAAWVEEAIKSVVAGSTVTKDLGGSATTQEYTYRVTQGVQQLRRLVTGE